MRTTVILSLLACILLPAAAVFGVSRADQPAPAIYVGSATCAGCHQGEAQRWEGSHHALAWTHPSDGKIKGDFDGSEFVGEGMRARFTTASDGTPVADVTEKDGTQRTYPVHSVVGTEPLQQYLFETEPGRLQSFDVVWDTEKKRWFHLYPGTDLGPHDGMHWTGPYKNWNGRCAVCHATGFEKNYDAVADTFASTAAEIGVGCEACHGPGSGHVAWVEAAAAKVPASGGLAQANGGFPIDLGERAVRLEQCAGCHSRREPLTEGTPPPGTVFHDAYNLSLLLPGLYQADGQIGDEVYVYGSFLQSRMYAMGVSCGDCHDPHSTRLRAEGNAVCTQCHNPAGNPRFPTLVKGDYDSPLHHFHETGTSGAECKNCHMAEKVYMGNDWRADHSFRIPRPDLGARTGASDACTACHTDRDPAWAAAEIAKRYPESDSRGVHYGEVLAAARADPAWAAGPLIGLAANGELPGVVRATALWLVARSGVPQAAAETASLLDDPDPVVRAAAVDVQRLAPPADRVLKLRPLLEDERLNVRIAAARTLLGQELPPEAKAAQANAEAEWQAAIDSRLDYPETHLQSAGMALTRRDFDAALEAFRKVTEMDPQRTEAWVMQVRIAAAQGDIDAALAVLDDALSANPFDRTLFSLARQLGPRRQQP